MASSFLEIVESGHSRQNTDAILEAIKKTPTRIDELMQLFFSDNLRHCQRAAWPVGFLGEKYPELLEPYMSPMLSNLELPKHDAIVRNTLRTWHFMDIPEEIEGPIFDRCMKYLMDTNQATAIRMFSMVICSNLAMKYPELKEELIPIIEDYAPHGTVGFRSRAKRELIRLRK